MIPALIRVHLLGLLLALSIACHCRSAETPALTDDGFALPQANAKFAFPRDHGSHPQFKIEWWYITGHLFATNVTSIAKDPAARFGFQATFFRRSAPTTAASNSTSTNFGSSQLFLAHMALLDVRTRQFIHEERLNRDGWDAASDTNTLAVRNGNWSLRFSDSVSNQMVLDGTIHGAARLHLTLNPAKPLVVFGTNSVSRKAVEPWATSHYLTFPRLIASGALTRGGESISVQGEAWMDHEISSSQLGKDQVGWDWACLQLNDGRELMVYRMRRSDGAIDPFSTLAWVNTRGQVSHASATEFSFEPLSYWTSSHTKAVYPAKVRIKTLDPEKGFQRSFTLEPLAADQELPVGMGGVSYWEGACKILDEAGREIGRAFLELTGYAGNLRSTTE